MIGSFEEATIAASRSCIERNGCWWSPKAKNPIHYQREIQT